MKNSRREFLVEAASVVAGTIAAGGCASAMKVSPAVGSMCGFATKPMEVIRVGFVGVGERGSWALKRVSGIPGIEIAAVCDLRPEAVDENVKWAKEHKRAGAMHEYKGTETIWKKLCEDPAVNLVYICTPAVLHAEMEVFAMAAGKHVMCEVPGAQTIEQCWAIVEASERNRVHCMMLENCVYGENELLAWNLCHQGLLGTLTHAEGAYIHNLVWRHLETHFRTRKHQKPGTVVHSYGNTYPTHALGPICTYMDMNRGDRMEKIVSLSSLSAAHPEFAKATYKPTDWQNNIQWLTGDMNTSIIRTAKGRTIMMQVDQSTPRPYSRINMIQGTKGCFMDYPPRFYHSDKPGGDAMKWGMREYYAYEDKKFDEIRTKYAHPLIRSAGTLAKKVGGHGGMDFMMDLRWIYCLRKGLPLDMDVYDLAAWSSIVPCSADSDRRGGEPILLPDFTRGGWATTKPISIGDVDLKTMGLANG